MRPVETRERSVTEVLVLDKEVVDESETSPRWTIERPLR